MIDNELVAGLFRVSLLGDFGDGRAVPLIAAVVIRKAGVATELSTCYGC